MTDNDLIEQFFSQARQMEVADNGFTERVMQQLPADSPALLASPVFLSRLWTGVCIIVAVALFIACRGWELIFYGMLLMMNNVQALHHLLIMAGALAVVLGGITISDVVSRERCRSL